jgi:hypothetical protein
MGDPAVPGSLVLIYEASLLLTNFPFIRKVESNGESACMLAEFLVGTN